MVGRAVVVVVGDGVVVVVVVVVEVEVVDVVLGTVIAGLVDVGKGAVT